MLSRDAAHESTGGGAGATARRETPFEDEQAEIEGDRAEIVARSELAAATRARWRLLDDSLRRVLAPWCALLCTPRAHGTPAA